MKIRLIVQSLFIHYFSHMEMLEDQWKSYFRVGKDGRAGGGQEGRVPGSQVPGGGQEAGEAAGDKKQGVNHLR